MAISPIGKQRSHPWNVSTNEGTETRKYDNSWPSNQGFSNFLFEQQLFITFQLVNFILNQIGRLHLYSNQETLQLLHTLSWRFYFKISPLVHLAPNIDLYLKLIIVLMFSINIIIWHCVTNWYYTDHRIATRISGSKANLFETNYIDKIMWNTHYCYNCI